MSGLYGTGVTLKSLLENPNLLNPQKQNTEIKNKQKDVDGCLTDFDFSSAFLGPAPVWDKNLPSTLTDFQLEYMDLDEFLNENGIDEDIETPTMPSLLEDSPPKLISRLGIQPPSPQTSSNSSSQLSPPLPSISPAKVVVESVESALSPAVIQIHPEALSPVTPSSPQTDYQVNEDDLVLSTVPEDDSDDGEEGELIRQYCLAEGQDDFDPRKRRFTDEELKPQPMIKKSKKIFVAEDAKDDKYWARRKKNNVAAKRSRDARRVKENQVAMRAAFLERQFEKMKADLAVAVKENAELKLRLAKYEH